MKTVASIPTQVLEICKTKLLLTKEQLLNQKKQMTSLFNMIDKSRGDESDLALAHQEEHSFIVNQNRLKIHLLEIEFAMARLENGSYGVCEETLQTIEPERLIAIPWTRLSIEGAEIREALEKKFAR